MRAGRIRRLGTLECEHMKDIALCHLSELDDPGSKGFEIDRADDVEPLSLFVIRRDNELRAYRNRCPHMGAPMNWQPDVFLDYDGHFIECALHGAIFDMLSGMCLRGPCIGEGLDGLKIFLKDEVIWLREEHTGTS